MSLIWLLHVFKTLHVTVIPIYPFSWNYMFFLRRVFQTMNFVLMIMFAFVKLAMGPMKPGCPEAFFYILGNKLLLMLILTVMLYYI